MLLIFAGEDEVGAKAICDPLQPTSNIANAQKPSA
jgi:hypothetical protein